MRVRRAIAFVGLLGLTMLVGGCADEGSGVAGPVPKETTPAKAGGDRPAAEATATASSPR
jgi:hypothetical protein